MGKFGCVLGLLILELIINHTQSAELDENNNIDFTNTEITTQSITPVNRLENVTDISNNADYNESLFTKVNETEFTSDNFAYNLTEITTENSTKDNELISESVFENNETTLITPTNISVINFTDSVILTSNETVDLDFMNVTESENISSVENERNVSENINKTTNSFTTLNDLISTSESILYTTESDINITTSDFDINETKSDFNITTKTENNSDEQTTTVFSTVEYNISESLVVSTETSNGNETTQNNTLFTEDEKQTTIEETLIEGINTTIENLILNETEYVTESSREFTTKTKVVDELENITDIRNFSTLDYFSSETVSSLENITASEKDLLPNSTLPEIYTTERLDSTLSNVSMKEETVFSYTTTSELTTQSFEYENLTNATTEEGSRENKTLIETEISENITTITTTSVYDFSDFNTSQLYNSTTIVTEQNITTEKKSDTTLSYSINTTSFINSSIELLNFTDVITTSNEILTEIYDDVSNVTSYTTDTFLNRTTSERTTDDITETARNITSAHADWTTVEVTTYQSIPSVNDSLDTSLMQNITKDIILLTTQNIIDNTSTILIITQNVTVDKSVAQNMTDDLSTSKPTSFEILTTVSSDKSPETNTMESATISLVPVTNVTTEMIEISTISSDGPVTISTTQMPIKFEKPLQNLTETEIESVVTVVFIAPNIKLYNWNSTYEKIFQRNLFSFLVSYLQEMENNQTIKEIFSSIIPENIKLDSEASVNSRSIIYVSPYPSLMAEQLFVSFFIKNNLKNDSVKLLPANVIIKILELSKSVLEEELGLTIGDIFQGVKLPMTDSTKSVGTEKSFIEQYATVFISVSVFIGLCLIFGIVTLIYLCCHHSQDYSTDKKKLKRDMRASIEIGDMADSREILSEEMGEKEIPGLLNGSGNHIIKMEDDVWVVPYSEIPLEERNPPDMQDTRL